MESIEIWCGNKLLDEEMALKVVVNYSPKNFCELKLSYKGYLQFRVSSEVLESFFVKWSNRIPSKSISLILIDKPEHDCFNEYDARPIYVINSEIIKKYIESGIIKKCELLKSKLMFNC